jgi:hypothetical protein
VVADNAIVRNVAVLHQVIVRPDDSFLAGLRGAIRREMFAKYIVVANAQSRRRPVVLQILRRPANHAAGMKPVVGADLRLARNVYVGSDNAVGANFHLLIYDDIRPNLDGWIQLRFGMNDGGWMNHVRDIVASLNA